VNIVGIKLNNNEKVYYFSSNGLDLKIDDNVIVETEKGLQYGIVVSFNSDSSILKKMELKNVIRIASKSDYRKNLSNIKDSEKAIVKCNELIKKYNLDMRIIDSYYTFDRSQLVFKFLSDDRVDFRQLAKDLGSIFKTRIELRQVGIRDKAKEIGGFGPCGRKLCCSNFLTSFDSVSINMAKNQNLSLNPSKINGVCGRLLCCLTYENDNYFEYKEGLPEVGRKIKTDDGDGKVLSVDVFSKTYKVLFPDNIVKVYEVKNDSKK